MPVFLALTGFFFRASFFRLHWLLTVAIIVSMLLETLLGRTFQLLDQSVQVQLVGFNMREGIVRLRQVGSKTTAQRVPVHTFVTALLNGAIVEL